MTPLWAYEDQIVRVETEPHCSNINPDYKWHLGLQVIMFAALDINYGDGIWWSLIIDFHFGN